MAEFDPDAYLARTEKRKERTTNSSFDPDAYLKKTAPETALQNFGRSSASLADSALNTLTGTLDYGAYALARAAGLSPEQATAETTSPKDVVGRAFGVAGTPGYENAPLRQAGTAIGQNLQSSVIEPIAETTGLPQQDVGNMLNTAMMGAGPAVPKVARAAKAVGTGAVDVVGGAAGAFGGDIARPGATPRPGQKASVRQPVGETYIPADVLEQYRAGTITAEQAQAQALPTSGLPQSALARTGGTVPYQGQGMRAFGEQLGQDYRNPYKLGAEVVGDYLLGGLPTAARLGYKAYQGFQGARAASQLEGLGFTPMTAAESQAFKNVPGPVSPVAAGVTPQAQQALTPNYLPALPAPGVPSTIPMGGPGRNVNIEGQSYQLPYQIDTSNSQAARPVSPADIARQTAASKVQGAAPGQSVQEIAVSKITPDADPVGQAARVAALQQRAMAAGGYTPPMNEAPPALPPMQSSTLDALKSTPALEQPAKPVATTPAPAVKSSMPNKSISENNVLASPNATKIDQATASTYKAQNPNYNITYDVVSIEGKGKKAKQVLTEVNEQAVDNKSFKAQPDITITEKITKTSSKGVETVFKGRTTNGIPIEIENLNSNSYYGPKLYAEVNGKKHLIREWSSYGEELNYRENDKIAKRLGINLKEMQHVAPEDLKSIDARGFVPDPETPFHHEYADPVRYEKYKTTGVDPKGIWETDKRQVETYKEKQAIAAAKKGKK